MDSTTKKLLACFKIWLLLSVHPIEAYRHHSFTGSVASTGEYIHSRDNSTGEGDIKEAVKRIEADMLQGDSSLEGIKGHLKRTLELYSVANAQKGEKAKFDSETVVMLRTALFKNIADNADKPGALQMQDFMQWIHDKDDQTIASELIFKMLFNGFNTEEAASKMQQAVSESPGKDPKKTQEQECTTFEKAQEAKLAKVLSAKGSALVQLFSEDPKEDASMQLAGALSTNASALMQLVSEGPDEAAQRLGNTTGGLVAQVFKAIWNLVSTVLAYVLCLIVCNLAVYFIASVFGLIWCVALKLLWKFVKMGTNVIHRKVKTGSVSGKVDNPFSEPDVLGEFGECMTPFINTAKNVAGTWAKNSLCMREVVTGIKG